MNDTEELGFDDAGWIIDKLGEDVLPEQDKRELTENAVQAVLRRQATDPGAGPGEVFWDVDEVYFAATGIRKLCVTDTGDAFDEAGFRANIMRLAPRGKTHSSLRNYGVGAKIAGVTRHPLGMVYQSWREPDEGIHAHLWRSPADGAYGLRRVELEDGKFETIAPIDGRDRPALIRSTGTRVTLLGTDEREDTFAPPATSEHGGKWLSRYLNTRYFELPDGVRVRVREGSDYRPGNWETGRIRTVTGQRPWLDSSSAEKGMFVGSDFRIWWWILSPDPERTKDSHYATGGFIAAKFLHELFDLKERGHAPAILQKFGITFGSSRVVLVVEPGVTRPELSAELESAAASVDLQRAHVKHNGQPLDWDRYAAEFRAGMPAEIRQLVEDEAHGGDDEGRRRRYRSSMEKLRELFNLPRYRPARSGPDQADPHVTGPGGGGVTGQGPSADESSPPRPPRGASTSGATGNVYPLRRAERGVAARATNELPDVDFRWVSDLDETLPERGGGLEDRAARYIPETNTLLINADFRLFELMVDHFGARYGTRPAARRVITEAVRDVYTGVLVETVVGMLAFRGDQQWSERRLAEALSEEALTAAVMPRVAAYRHIGQILRGHYPGAA